MSTILSRNPIVLSITLSADPLPSFNHPVIAVLSPPSPLWYDIAIYAAEFHFLEHLLFLAKG
jgi:hypothetical protein